MKQIKEHIVVLYHAECRDGLVAAWVAWKKFGKKAMYIPVFYGQPAPKNVTHKHVYLVDFCYDKKELAILLAANKKVVVLDHHITRKEETQSVEGSVFSNTHSGASLAWNYFFPKTKMPWLVRYVEDADLWRWKMPHSRHIIAVIDSLAYNFLEVDVLFKELESARRRKQFIPIGEGIERYKQTLVHAVVAKAQDAMFQGFRARIASAPRAVGSDVANALHKKKGVHIGIAWRYEYGKFIISLRSRVGSKVNVATLAERYGGGGHKHAAGFTVVGTDIAKLPWRVVKSE